MSIQRYKRQPLSRGPKEKPSAFEKKIIQFLTEILLKLDVRDDGKHAHKPKSKARKDANARRRSFIRSERRSSMAVSLRQLGL